MQFGWNFLFSKLNQEEKKSSYDTSIITLWYWFFKHGWIFANNLYILYFHTHIYYVDFLGECLFFIWVYLDKIVRLLQLKIPDSATAMLHHLRAISITTKQREQREEAFSTHNSNSYSNSTFFFFTIIRAFFLMGLREYIDMENA